LAEKATKENVYSGDGENTYFWNAEKIHTRLHVVKTQNATI
jgi:hypothetical protein